jgi:outer membrane lipoprotein-sorting protein
MKNHIYLCFLIFLAMIFISGCTEVDDGPSDSIIKFTFHPDCSSVKLEVYIDNEYSDLIYSDGSYQYHVDPGTHSYSLRRASDSKVIWSGQITVPKGKIQNITLTCN